MKHIVRLLVFVAFATHAEAAPPEPLACTLRGPSTFPWGSTPLFEVSILNQTSKEICLVGSLDGSDVRWRYPYCYFEVIGPDGKSAVVVPSRCGNMNSLNERAFVRIPPGAAFDPFMPDRGFVYPSYLTAATFRVPGEYSVRFVYSTESEEIAEWAGILYEYPPVVIDRLRSHLAEVPKTRVVSNEVRIRILKSAK